MKPRSTLFVSSLFVWLALALAACGEAHHDAQTASKEPASLAAENPPNTPTVAKGQILSADKGDDDYDDAHGAYDSDNAEVLDYGKAASPADKSAIVGLVKRYYGVAAAGDGRSGCALIYPPLAKAIPEDYGRAPGPLAWRGKSCAVVMSKLFGRIHRKLTAEVGVLLVRSVRVDRNEGLVLLRFGKSSEERVIAVRRLGRVWGIDALTDGGLA